MFNIYFVDYYSVASFVKQMVLDFYEISIEIFLKQTI